MTHTAGATEQSVLTLDYRSLALFRVSMGLVILFDLARRSFDIPASYTDEGLLPRAALIGQHWYDRYTSLYMLTGDASGVGALFAIMTLTVGVLLIVAFVENLTQTPGYDFTFPRPLSILLSRSELTQNWSMFTGLHGYQRGWFLIPAKLANGSEVDLFRSAQPLFWGRPERPHAWISDNHWYKYYSRLDSPRYAFTQPYLGRYLCERWNRSRDADDKIEVLYVAYVAQDPLPSERVDPRNSRILVEQECRPGASQS